MTRPEPYTPNFRRLAQRVRVPAGFVLAPLLVIIAQPTRGSLVCGAIVTLAGLATRTWASGHLRKNTVLATTGPYAHTRNPLYFGNLLLGAGIAVSTASVWFVILLLGVYLLVYLPVMRAEEETLRHLFPRDYDDYSNNVPLFIPRLMPYVQQRDQAPEEAGTANRMNQATGFCWALYTRHREYRAFIGAGILYLIIVLKAYLTGGI